MSTEPIVGEIAPVLLPPLLQTFVFRSGWGEGADRGALRAAKKANMGTEGIVPKGYLKKVGMEEEGAALNLMESEHSGFKTKDMINIKGSDAVILIMRWDSKNQKHQDGVGRGTQQCANYIYESDYSVNEPLLKVLSPHRETLTAGLFGSRSSPELLVLFVFDNDVERFVGQEEYHRAVCNMLRRRYKNNVKDMETFCCENVMVGGPTEETLPGIELGVERFFDKVFETLKDE